MIYMYTLYEKLYNVDNASLIYIYITKYMYVVKEISNIKDELYYEMHLCNGKDEISYTSYYMYNKLTF